MTIKTKTSPPRSTHRQRKYDAMTQKILNTARAIMREHGVAALSMQELARRLDLRASSLYHYFPGKMEIYDALFRLGFALYAAQIEESLQKVQTWQEFVRGGFETYFQFAKNHPELFQLCFERPVPGFVPSEEGLQVSFQLLERGYQRAAELEGDIRTDLPTRKLVDLLISMMHGITALHMANEPDKPIGEGRFGSLIPAAVDLIEKAWL